jgi:hypothetical protein
MAVELIGLPWTERLHKLRVWLLLGLVSLAVAGWAIYSWEGGNRCLMAASQELSKEISTQTGVDTSGQWYREFIAAYDTPKEQRTPAQQKLLDLVEGSFAKTDVCKENWSMLRWFSMLEPVSRAHAQALPNGNNSADAFRQMMLVGVFGMMAIAFFVSFGAVLFSKNEKVVSFAMDSVKSLLGFFIGVGMTFFGVVSH